MTRDLATGACYMGTDSILQVSQQNVRFEKKQCFSALLCDLH